MNKNTFIIVCTGTAGHINPGLAIAKELCDRIKDARVIFIGAGRDMEKQLIPAAGYELINLKMSGIKRRGGVMAITHNINTLINVFKAGREATRVLNREKPAAVIGTGGYICYPVIKAAVKIKIPAYIHESNAKPGMTVKMLSGIADKVMITYPGFEKEYKKPENLILTGTPIRKEIIDAIKSAAKDNRNQTRQKTEIPLEQRRKPLVISFWGSLGAGRMNEMMKDFTQLNIKNKSFYHIHATGKATGETQLKSEPPYSEIREYIEDMPETLVKSDLVLCRAGGITLAELTAANKPGILIPSPYVPDNIQSINAKQLSDRGAAIVLNETDCTGEILYNTAAELLNNKEELNKMADNAGKLGAIDATKRIVDIILDGNRQGEHNGTKEEENTGK